MTKEQKLAIIDAILALNAAIVGEPQKVFVTTMPKGWIRIGYRRGESRSYPSIDAALTAAFAALSKARERLP